MKKIAILGGTGFVGKMIANELRNRGFQVVLWSRNPNKYNNLPFEVNKWPLDEGASYGDVEAIINLAGETINQRWTRQAKQRIRDSRVKTTQLLIQYIEKGVLQPKVLINGSAIGYYGRDDEFLTLVSKDWEGAAELVIQMGVRLVIARLGVVLGTEEGALPRMVLPYRLFIGGTVGSGEQWVSWVHVQDVANIIAFILEKQELQGAINITAPSPVQMKEFGRIVAKVTGRPHWLPVPSFALKLLLGEMSKLILEGEKILPDKLEEVNYPFLYRDLESALRNLL